MINRVIGIVFSVVIVTMAFTVAAFAQTGQTNSSMNDREVLRVLKTIDEGEIAAGKYASKKAKNAEVKNFAKSMVDVHTKHISDTKNLASKNHLEFTESPMTKTLKEEAKAAMADLKSKEKEGLDATYMTQQVSMHEKALDTIRTTLIPSAQNPDLKKLLQDTESTVAQHLDHAKQLQAKM